MNDRELRRYEMFGRVQTFGTDNKDDFAPDSKAVTHFENLAARIKELDAAKASQHNGAHTAKEVLLDALRLDLQNVARMAKRQPHRTRAAAGKAAGRCARRQRTVGTGTAGKHSDVAQELANTIRQVRPRKFWLVPSASEKSTPVPARRSRNQTKLRRRRPRITRITRIRKSSREILFIRAHP